MRFLRWAALIGLAISPTFVQAQDATPTPDPCQDLAHEFVQWLTNGTDCTLHEEISLSFDADYPHDLAQQSPFAGSVMLGYINQERDGFWANLGGDMLPEFFGSGPWTMDIKYETFHHSPSLVSVLFTTYAYTGGAHGGSYFRTFTFDLTNESMYSLDGLFRMDLSPREILAPIVRASLETTLADFPDFIESGTEPYPEGYPEVDNYANWVLTSDALVIYFPEYQVAPYVAGPQMVSIPLTDLADVLNPDVVCIPGAAC